MEASSRLMHLLKLADSGPTMRAALSEEVADLLIEWPANYLPEMRGACEALLARAAREVDEKILTRLHARLQANPQLAARLLPRKERSLIETARRGGIISAPLAQALDLSQSRIRNILSDSSGHSLAIACKGTGLPRATFSTLVILLCGKSDAAQTGARLNAYDAVNLPEAKRQLHNWRASDLATHAA